MRSYIKFKETLATSVHVYLPACFRAVEQGTHGEIGIENFSDSDSYHFYSKSLFGFLVAAIPFNVSASPVLS